MMSLKNCRGGWELEEERERVERGKREREDKVSQQVGWLHLISEMRFSQQWNLSSPGNMDTTTHT